MEFLTWSAWGTDGKGNKLPESEISYHSIFRVSKNEVSDNYFNRLLNNARKDDIKEEEGEIERINRRYTSENKLEFIKNNREFFDSFLKNSLDLYDYGK